MHQFVTHVHWHPPLHRRKVDRALTDAAFRCHSGAKSGRSIGHIITGEEGRYSGRLGNPRGENNSIKMGQVTSDFVIDANMGHQESSVLSRLKNQSIVAYSGRSHIQGPIPSDLLLQSGQALKFSV